MNILPKNTLVTHVKRKRKPQKMTADNFTSYLNNPSHLYQISYQELKSLVVQYPYCQNLRYLLVSKSHLENVGEYNKDLELAATYSVDRTYLYQLIHKEEMANSSENFILNDDYLELKNISTPSEQQDVPPSESIVVEQKADYSLDIDIPQENIETNITPQKPSKKDYIPAESRTIRVRRVNLTTSDSEPPASAAPDVPLEKKQIEEKQVPISNQLEIRTEMEKNKETRSVIDQLLGNFTPNKDVEPKEVIAIEQEQESETTPPESVEVNTNDDFWGVLPVKESPKLGREVLFEITNKTDKEMDALFQDKKASDNQNTPPMDSFTEDELSPKNSDTTSPTPKTSFQSYMNQFQTPPEIIEEIKDEPELHHAINEAIEEEEKVEIKKKGKKKKKKKKKLKQKKLIKVKSKKKKKHKKKKKTLEVAQKSIEENQDILSETLAELLAQQGSRKKAIRMYKRLSLIFPKKSGFFAKKIAKLKK